MSDRLAIRLVLTVLAGLLIFCWILFMNAFGHEAGPGWQYDMECCHDQDCAPVIKAEISSYSTVYGLVPPVLSPMTVTTIHGTGDVPNDMPRRISKDARMHACIRNGIVICIYVPPGS